MGHAVKRWSAKSEKTPPANATRNAQNAFKDLRETDHSSQEYASEEGVRNSTGVAYTKTTPTQHVRDVEKYSSTFADSTTQDYAEPKETVTMADNTETAGEMIPHLHHLILEGIGQKRKRNAKCWRPRTISSLHFFPCLLQYAPDPQEWQRRMRHLWILIQKP